MRRAKDLLMKLSPSGYKADVLDTEQSQQYSSVWQRAAWHSTLTVRLDTCPVRAAFSHVPLWKILSADLGLLGEHMKTRGLFPLAEHKLTSKRRQSIMSKPAPIQNAWVFRQRTAVSLPGEIGCNHSVFLLLLLSQQEV